ncbi:hypothetical protein [Sediminibacterium ginsengisoli]|uniref:Uncharacterized protein n=1 Tax=Sediminibacterium ginsengisoli TaxID=413434 RepID=A0A1T4Q3Y8_9BACT|nr:hypothetical protein [Sediminibacterium ginsengisoli]SJZ97918.1 hypothetical protein SAMN04488132_107106 [Sediminibacterium ginsengisoli]
MNIGIIVVVIVLALALLFFLTRKNMKDRKELNPDAQDAMEEEKADHTHDRI